MASRWQYTHMAYCMSLKCTLLGLLRRERAVIRWQIAAGTDVLHHPKPLSCSWRGGRAGVFPRYSYKHRGYWCLIHSVSLSAHWEPKTFHQWQWIPCCPQRSLYYRLCFWMLQTRPLTGTALWGTQLTADDWVIHSDRHSNMFGAQCIFIIIIILSGLTVNTLLCLLQCRSLIPHAHNTGCASGHHRVTPDWGYTTKDSIWKNTSDRCSLKHTKKTHRYCTVPEC